jgi:hypothetical protein
VILIKRHGAGILACGPGLPPGRDILFLIMFSYEPQGSGDDPRTVRITIEAHESHRIATTCGSYPATSCSKNVLCHSPFSATLTPPGFKGFQDSDNEPYGEEYADRNHRKKAPHAAAKMLSCVECFLAALLAHALGLNHRHNISLSMLFLLRTSYSIFFSCSRRFARPDNQLVVEYWFVERGFLPAAETVCAGVSSGC